jgi:hypothetical protein
MGMNYIYTGLAILGLAAFITYVDWASGGMVFGL